MILRMNKLSVRALDAALTNMTAVVGNGRSDAEAKFAMLKRDVEVVEDELCAKVQNVSNILEVAKESSEQSISAIKQNIIKLAAKQQENIDRLTTRVSQQGQSVNQLSDSVTDQEKRLDNLTSTVEKQSSGIARLKEDVHPIKTGKQYRQISWNVYVLNYIKLYFTNQPYAIHSIILCKMKYQLKLITMYIKYVYICTHGSLFYNPNKDLA